MRTITLKMVKRNTMVRRMAVRKAVEAVFREEKEGGDAAERTAQKESVKKAAAKTK